MKSTGAPNNSFKRQAMSGLTLNSNVGIKSQTNTFGLVIRLTSMPSDFS